LVLTSNMQQRYERIQATCQWQFESSTVKGGLVWPEDGCRFWQDTTAFKPSAALRKSLLQLRHNIFAVDCYIPFLLVHFVNRIWVQNSINTNGMKDEVKEPNTWKHTRKNCHIKMVPCKRVDRRHEWKTWCSLSSRVTDWFSLAWWVLGYIMRNINKNNRIGA
jgi:hypothetical protein